MIELKCSILARKAAGVDEILWERGTMGLIMTDLTLYLVSSSWAKCMMVAHNDSTISGSTAGFCAKSLLPSHSTTMSGSIDIVLASVFHRSDTRFTSSDAV